MNESSQAERVARWLDQPMGGDVPDDVDADVIEAIFALRPEAAPAPRITIDDILAEVVEGPLSSVTAQEDDEALALVRTMSDPDESIDADPVALQGLYALRPDRAPAPRLDIDDILASVTAGPFAARPAGANTPMAAAGPDEAPANVIPLRARGRWLLPGLGAMLAAALALLVVLPTTDELPTGFPAPPTGQHASPPADAPTSRAATAPLSASSADPIVESDDRPKAAPAPKTSAPPPPPPAAEPSLAIAEAGPQPVLQEIAASERFAIAEDLGTALGDGTSGLAGGATAGRAFDESDDLLDAAPVEEEASAAQVVTVEATRRDRGVRTSAAPAAAPAPARESVAKDVSRAESKKSDADTSDEQASYNAADAAIAAGDAATAEALLRPLLDSKNRLLVASAAARLGQLLLDQNRLSEANVVVRKGLSVAPLGERSRLQALADEIAARQSTIPEVEP